MNLREERSILHQEWSDSYTKHMAMGLPQLARLAVDGIVKAIFMKYELLVTQSFCVPKNMAFKKELEAMIKEKKDKHNWTFPQAR